MLFFVFGTMDIDWGGGGGVGRGTDDDEEDITHTSIYSGSHCVNFFSFS